MVKQTGSKLLSFESNVKNLTVPLSVDTDNLSSHRSGHQGFSVSLVLDITLSVVMIKEPLIIPNS